LPALSNDTIKVTEKLNGGTVGLAQRIQWHSKWEAMDITIPAWSTPSKPRPSMLPSAPKPAPLAQPNLVTAFLDVLKSIFKRG
jgi:putative chitinase